MTVEQKLQEKIEAARKELAEAHDAVEKEIAANTAKANKWERESRGYMETLRQTATILDRRLSGKLYSEIGSRQLELQKFKAGRQKGKEGFRYSFDFDRMAYFVSRLNELDTPDYVFKHNSNYCRAVLRAIADDYAQMEMFLSDVGEKRKKAFAAEEEKYRASYRRTVASVWEQLQKDIGALAKEKSKELLVEVDKKCTASVKEEEGRR